jgi:TonB family protein
MRRILTASVLLSPMLFLAVAHARTPVEDSSASTPVPRISTGVTRAHLLSSAPLEIPAGAIDEALPPFAEVSLTLNVDAKGKAEDIQVVKSVNPRLDARVVSAVRELRFRPATLDKEPIATPMTLHVVVQH